MGMFDNKDYFYLIRLSFREERKSQIAITKTQVISIRTRILSHRPNHLKSSGIQKLLMAKINAAVEEIKEYRYSDLQNVSILKVGAIKTLASGSNQKTILADVPCMVPSIVWGPT